MSAPLSSRDEPPPTVLLASFGATTSIGLDGPGTVASVRCGLTRFCEQNELRNDTTGDPIVLALLPTLAEESTATERMVALAADAGREALRPWLEAARTEKLPPLPILLSVPPPRPGYPVDGERALAQAIIQALPVEPDRHRSELFASGHAGGLSALAQALELLQDPHVPACLVGGTDSPRLLTYLRWLDAQERLKRDGQPHGLIPGEGAGFLLVCREDFMARHRWVPLAGIQRVAQTLEPRLWYQGDATHGEALTDAFWQVLRPSDGAPLRADVTWCDFNGEPWRSEEWSFAYLRTGKYHGEPLDLRHPADCWGDLGAASAPLLVGLAASELARGREGHQTALVWCASDVQPWRAACLLNRIHPKEATP